MYGTDFPAASGFPDDLSVECWNGMDATLDSKVSKEFRDALNAYLDEKIAKAETDLAAGEDAAS